MGSLSSKTSRSSLACLLVAAHICIAMPAYAALSPSVKNEFARGFVGSCEAKATHMYPNLTPDNVQYACLCSVNSIANEFNDETIALAVAETTRNTSAKIAFAKKHVHPCLSKAIARQYLLQRYGLPYKD